MATTVTGLDPNAPNSWWWSSGHRAMQSTITDWSQDNVRVTADGTVEFVLDNAGSGALEPFAGGEINSTATATTGTFSWTAQAPKMVDGAVFGLFAYKADWKDDPWLEFDFEWAGPNTNEVHLTVHMEDAAGKHITNLEKTVIDLGFDAAAGFHTYDVVLDGTSAVFRADGQVIAYFSGADMPGGVWNTGSLKSIVDLWAADSRYDGWTGHWTDPGVPLAGRVSAASVRPGDLSGAKPILGTAGADVLTGTASRDVIDGLAGNDTLRGGDGADRIMGGHGNDVLHLDTGNDVLNGGTGVDWVTASGSSPVTLNLLNTWGDQDTLGFGRDSLRDIENAAGGSGADKVYGSGGDNVLVGGGGNDYLEGRAGADTLIGGQGRDMMSAGTDSQRDVFVFQSVLDSGVGSTVRDVVQSFAKGTDKVDLSAIDANTQGSGQQAFTWGGTAAGAHKVWTATSGSNTILRGDTTGDGVADFEIQVNNVTGLGSSDLILGASPVTQVPTNPTQPPAPKTPIAEDTVSVKIRGDAYQGDPVFDLLVNGKVVRTGVAVTADRVDGQWDTFSFHGDFDLDGTDRVGIRFTNDLCHRAADRSIIGDRNLYVDAVTLNGETNGRDQTFYSAGTGYWDF